MIQKLFGKRALWRVALNELHWIITEPRVLAIRLVCLSAYLRMKLTDKSHFKVMHEADFQASRKSDRVFLFGSGWSLNEISPEGWAHIAEHDTFGFSMFVYQNWIRTDYHMLRELYLLYELDKSFWYPYSQEFAHYFDTNPQFDQTIFLAQSGWRSLTVNRLIGLNMLTKPRRMLPFKVVKGLEGSPPNFRLEDGVIHGSGTLTDAVNLAAIGGWKHIILAGVDLYDGHYFWEENHVTTAQFGNDPTKIHNTVRLGIIDNLEQWRDILRERGIYLWVYNPKSLLTEILPLYTPEAFAEFEKQSEMVS